VVAVSVAPGQAPVPTRVRVVMPSAILNRFEQVRAYEPLFAGPAAVPEATLHALRIDCKALRYSLEPVEHLLGPDGAKLVAQLKVLQDLLGDLNDAAVMRARLLEMQLGGLPPEGAAAYKVYQTAQAAELAARVPDAWRAFTDLENRRRLALAIAEL
jgi:CHAD domain-containing protein